jgi:hypothetical protein
MLNKKTILKSYWFLSTQLGIDPVRFLRTIISIPYFLKTIFKFKKEFKGKFKLYPCLQDRNEESGAVNSEYFWQDLIVARWIFEANPQKHVDIGSRVDGFVAHIASFREVEVIDVRPIKSNIPNIIFKQGDMMDSAFLNNTSGLQVDYCDSLSCLHTIEHFGLGRYGDPIDPKGYQKGILNMTSLIKKGGVFYLSTPIGVERVEFNANWIFYPINIIQLVESQGFIIEKFITYNNGVIKQIDPNSSNLEELSKEEYNLGIFIFRKNNL